jgi:hypothetical protein
MAQHAAHHAAHDAADERSSRAGSAAMVGVGATVIWITILAVIARCAQAFAGAGEVPVARRFKRLPVRIRAAPNTVKASSRSV